MNEKITSISHRPPASHRTNISSHRPHICTSPLLAARWVISAWNVQGLQQCSVDGIHAIWGATALFASLRYFQVVRMSPAGGVPRWICMTTFWSFVIMFQNFRPLLLLCNRRGLNRSSRSIFCSNPCIRSCIGWLWSRGVHLWNHLSVLSLEGQL